MLAYLDALCDALRRRDAARIEELLRHPLASALPSGVRDEARRIIASDASDTMAPVQTLRLYHQTAHLLGACSDPASRNRGAAFSPPTAGAPRQIEFDFPIASGRVAEPSVVVAAA